MFYNNHHHHHHHHHHRRRRCNYRRNLYALYIVETRQKTMYIGITTNVADRLDKHHHGLCVKLDCNTFDFELAYQSNNFMCASCAVRVKYLVKRMSRTQKLKLINGRINIEQCVKFKCRRFPECGASSPTASTPITKV
ncbi:endonuclease [Orgyia leucostigma nucleopolyhedrovirus]|uniref:Endonuclease n=1 Tax=Orgyia leucostigma nucleopolyhedrovirus TaxID=490711 RepID=B0FDW5_9ABAC|nr:endonuclease [Orgyia leucostigma nucleopolyhedrovirus]ABY65823.1 endonuclease [Orgyia leucostigma nucleopolyhedrovirus]